jgi:hypothetical protein
LELHRSRVVYFFSTATPPLLRFSVSPLSPSLSTLPHHLLFQTPCRRTNCSYPKFIAICSVESARARLALRIPNLRSLGNDNRVMFATLPSHVHQAHNPHYNPPVSNPPNGLAHLPNGNDSQNAHHQQPPPPAQSHRPTPPAVSKEPINVVGIPSVSVQTDRLIVGNSESRQCSLGFSSVFLTHQFPRLGEVIYAT